MLRLLWMLEWLWTDAYISNCDVWLSVQNWLILWAIPDINHWQVQYARIRNLLSLLSKTKRGQRISSITVYCSHFWLVSSINCAAKRGYKLTLPLLGAQSTRGSMGIASETDYGQSDIKEYRTKVILVDKVQSGTVRQDWQGLAG